MQDERSPGRTIQRRRQEQGRGLWPKRLQRGVLPVTRHLSGFCLRRRTHLLGKSHHFFARAI